jgi:hypothetical protein
MVEPKAQSKKMTPIDLIEEEEKAEAEVEEEPMPKKEEENLGKASPKDISDTHPINQGSLWKMKNSAALWKYSGECTSTF